MKRTTRMPGRPRSARRAGSGAPGERAGLERLLRVRQRLLSQQLHAREAERGRLARDLHDETAQVLTFLFVNLRMLEEAESLDAARLRIRELAQLAERAIAQVRGLVRSLRPTLLEDLGLEAELSLLTTEIERDHGVAIDLQTAGLDDRRLPADVEIALYRIAEEALANVARHARARHASVVVQRTGSAVQLIIEDDGRGFKVDWQQVEEGARPLGLLGLRERVALLDGTLDIDSAPGRGTSLRARIPMGRR